MTATTATMTRTITLSEDDIALLREAVEFEIQNTRDMIRDMPDATDNERDTIRIERTREDRLEAIFSNLR